MSEIQENVERGKEKLFKRSKERAMVCLNKREYSRAFAHFLVAVTLKPDVEDDFMNLFLYTLGIISNELEVQQNFKDLFMCYDQTLDVLPHNSQVLHGLASILFRHGHISSATSYFQKAYRENPFFTPSLYCIDNIKSCLVERWHFMMLNDKQRNLAFAEAIRRAVGSGCESVLDIGAGTGILSLIAADAGAKDVYACEGSDVMFQVLKSVVEANEKNICVLEKFSYDIVIPEDIPKRVDLVVTEIFDAALFGEHVLKTLKHAWKHLIKKDNGGEKEFTEQNKAAGDISANENPNKSCDGSKTGKVIPHSATVWTVPIECEHVRKYSRVCCGALNSFGIDSASASASVTFSEPYTTEKLDSLQGGYRFLSCPKQLFSINFNDPEEIECFLKGKTFDLLFGSTADGQIDALALWFDLNLDNTIRISTKPGSDCCWEQAIFPVLSHHFNGTSNSVQNRESVKVSFECKGHLKLVQVDMPSDCQQPAKLVTLNSEIISHMNLMHDNRLSSVDFCSKLVELDCQVLDISLAPLIGLKCLVGGASKLVVLPSKYLMDINTLMNHGNIERGKMRVMSYEEICAQPSEYGLVVTEPVEMCGLLKKNIFEDIALLRNLQTGKPFHILPKKIGIYAVLFESSVLRGQTKVLSDGHCLDYKISEFINSYKCNIHQDLQISTMSHSKLCNQVKLTDIDLEKLTLEKNKLQSFVEFSGSVEVSVTRAGSVTAIPYWFSLHYDQDLVVDTSSPKTQWKQAAIVTDDTLEVAEGETVCLEWVCRNSCLNVCVKKC